MTAEQSVLVERLRDRLAADPTREISMFGARAFMVNEKLAVAVWKHGDLLVRVPTERHEELATRPGAHPAEMAGRTMGEGWISVTAASIESAAALESWLTVALDHNRGM